MISAMLPLSAPYSRHLSVAAVLLFVVVTVASGGHASAGANETEARTLFTKFVAAQNAHNAGDVKAMLWNSPSMLLFARGVETRGPEAVAARFKEYYEGTWHLEPDMSQFRVAAISRDVMQNSCPHRFHAWPSRQPVAGQHISDQPNVRPRCNRLVCRFHPTDRKHPTQIAAARVPAMDTAKDCD
jgi:hypothetical protein